MIIELVATCFLMAGQTYTPPGGWTIERLGIQGLVSPCHGNQCYAIVVYPVERSYVTLRRPAKVGEKIEAPAGCDMTVETKP